MPNPKGEWSKKKIIQNFIMEYVLKVNQFIYILVCNYRQNVRILAKAVLQIFCSQCCSYTKCLCPENRSNSTENLWLINSSTPWTVTTNIRILAKAVLQLFCSQGCTYRKNSKYWDTQTSYRSCP